MELIEKHPVISAGPFVSSTYSACSSLMDDCTIVIKNDFFLSYATKRENNFKNNFEEGNSIKKTIAKMF